MIWHTRNEKKILKQLHAKPHGQSYDGILPNGRPVEIREARKDDRYRIAQNCHKQMVAMNGIYIFVNNGQQKQIPAKQVSKMMGNGNWFKDRDYPHKFLKVKKVF